MNQERLTPTFVRKLETVQLLIRRTYGAGRFSKYAGWSKRKLVSVTRDPDDRRIFGYSDGRKA